RPTILNIAAGKLLPLNLPENFFLINLDISYFSSTEPGKIEEEYEKWIHKPKMFRCNCDAFRFMERCAILFDRVSIYRFLEHVPMDQVLYFIYLISTITKVGSEVEVIVPNYRILASKILNEDNPASMPDFEKHNILLTTEMLNEPSCPHTSIWTAARAVYFWELEGRFKVRLDDHRFNFDGRDIYLKFTAIRSDK
ncbi:MAG: hypothetical protein PVG65_01975, partial [Candidatus Thorarchaeota archaeon]